MKCDLFQTDCVCVYHQGRRLKRSCRQDLCGKPHREDSLVVPTVRSTSGMFDRKWRGFTLNWFSFCEGFLHFGNKRCLTWCILFVFALQNKEGTPNKPGEESPSCSLPEITDPATTCTTSGNANPEKRSGWRSTVLNRCRVRVTQSVPASHSAHSYQSVHYQPKCVTVILNLETSCFPQQRKHRVAPAASDEGEQRSARKPCRR